MNTAQLFYTGRNAKLLFLFLLLVVGTARAVELEPFAKVVGSEWTAQDLTFRDGSQVVMQSKFTFKTRYSGPSASFAEEPLEDTHLILHAKWIMTHRGESLADIEIANRAIREEALKHAPVVKAIRREERQQPARPTSEEELYLPQNEQEKKALALYRTQVSGIRETPNLQVGSSYYLLSWEYAFENHSFETPAENARAKKLCADMYDKLIAAFPPK